MRIHSYKVKALSPCNESTVIWAGTDYQEALTVYVHSTAKHSKAEFIELYKDGEFVRSTIGRK